MARHRIRTALSVSATLATVVALAAACGGGTDASGAPNGSAGTPRRGGSIVVGGLGTSQMDPGQLGYSLKSNQFTQMIFGGLFLPPDDPKGDVKPDLATGYQYSPDGLTLTLNLRPGAKFQDGTPVDAGAVVWNLNRAKDPKSTSGQYFKQVTNIAASGSDKVVITFKQPDNLLLSAFANMPAGFLGSPTAFDKLGPSKFATNPVGAGPFMVKSATPGQQMVLVRSVNYWDAEHVYLDQITILNTGDNAQANYVKMQSGAVQSISLPAATTAPAVIQQAMKDKSLSYLTTTSTRYQMLPINTFVAPFNDIRARQAVAYCIDREGIAKSVQQGLATPAYIISGPDSLYLDGWEDGKSLNPYQYDVNKSKQLVSELGGLSFTVESNLKSPAIVALQQGWQECGMKVDIKISAEYLTDVEEGNYQMSYTTGANTSLDPALITTYQDPNSAQNSHGFRDDTVFNLIAKAKTLRTEAELKAAWREIWAREAELAVDIPVISAPYYLFQTKCLKGVETYSLAQFDHAYLTC